MIPTMYTLTRRIFFIILIFHFPKILMTKTSSDIFSRFSVYVVDLYICQCLDHPLNTFPLLNELLIKYTGSSDGFSVASSSNFSSTFIAA